jgi:hypothetical protein
MNRATTSLEYDSHVRDFQKFVAGRSAKQPAKRHANAIRRYAGRRIVAALI